MDLAAGDLVQVDADRNALLGTPLARGLHSVLLRADAGATFSRETNSFVFSSAAKLQAVVKALTRMVEQKSYPIEGTYASSLEGWYPLLNARNAAVNGHDVMQFRTAGEFSRALKGLAMIEDAVHLEPHRLISDRNAVFARPRLQDLGVVYLPDAEMYLPLNRANEAAVAQTLGEAGRPTAMQRATIEVALSMLPDEERDRFDHNYDRAGGSDIIENMSKRLGPALDAAVAERYPNLAAEAEATLSAAAVEATAARAAAILTNDVGPAVVADYKGTRAREADIYADREAARDQTDPLRVLPISDMHPNAGSLASLGAALRELRESGEASFKNWRLANAGEIVQAPVAAQNRDWIIQRNDKGVAIIHSTDILKDVLGGENKRPRVIEDLRVPVTLGVDHNGMTVFEQPDIELSSDPDPVIAWAKGSPKGGNVSSPEFVASSNATRRAERIAVNNYALSGYREAEALAVAELTRRGLDADANAARRVMPEPTSIGRPHRGEVIGQTRDGMFTVLHMIPRPENKPAKIMTVETVMLLGEKLVTGDLRKGDYISFGFEKVADTVIPIQVTRIPSPEQAAALAASRAAGMVNFSEKAHERVTERVADFALQKFTEWHRGKTGFPLKEAPVLIDPQPGMSYAGPIVGFSGKYAIQNLGPGDDGLPQIALHDCDIIPKRELSFVSADMVLTLAYHQEERGLVDAVNITDARPLRDYGYAWDSDLANELRVNNPALAYSIQKAVGVASGAPDISEHDRAAVITRWSTGDDIGKGR